MAKNYYTILGVLPTATLDEIRSAYRSRVKQFHPDRFGEDSSPFLNVQEAYDVLCDPANRSSYDRSLRETDIRTASSAQPIPVEIRPRRPSVEPLKDPRKPADLGTIFPRTSFNHYFPSFDEIFDNLWNTLDRPPASKPERFQTLTMEVRLTRDQARRGGCVQINLPMQHSCPACDGLGDVGPFQCWRCNGTGAAVNEFSLQVEYPPGIQDFYRIAIPLDRYGIPDVCPVLLFRISSEGDFEDLF